MNLDLLKRRWYYFAPAVLLLIPLFLLLGATLKFGYSVGEAWQTVLHMGQSNTRYAQKFSESAFEQIKPGMDGKTVFQMIGVPLEGQSGLEWHYSFGGNGAKYFHKRVVIFVRDVQNVPRVKSMVKRFETPAS
jgi:hypothetical protein